jgi:hypothetical protein
MRRTHEASVYVMMSLFRIPPCECHQKNRFPFTSIPKRAVIANFKRLKRTNATN